jgi:hypothetical protein
MQVGFDKSEASNLRYDRSEDFELLRIDCLC